MGEITCRTVNATVQHCYIDNSALIAELIFIGFFLGLGMYFFLGE